MRNTPEIQRVIDNFKRDYDAKVTILELEKPQFAVRAQDETKEIIAFVWERTRDDEAQQDKWLYICLADDRTYSHPSLSGAIAGALKGMVKRGDFKMQGANSRLDDKDETLRENGALCRQLLETPSLPMNGDVLRYPDGELKRVAHVWEGSGAQPDSSKGDSSFCFSVKRGGMSYSGGLGSIIPMDKIKATDERHEAPAWFFHHDQMRAHNAVQCTVSVRIWEVLD